MGFKSLSDTCLRACRQPRHESCISGFQDERAEEKCADGPEGDDAETLPRAS